MKTITFILLLFAISVVGQKSTITIDNLTKQARTNLTAKKAIHDSLFSLHSYNMAIYNATTSEEKKKRKNLNKNIIRIKKQIQDNLDNTIIIHKYFRLQELSNESLREFFDFPPDLLLLAQKADITNEQRKERYLETRNSLLETDYNYKEGDKKVKVVQPELLNTKINTIFNQTVFSNDDLVNNASAFGFSQNEEKTTISGNINLKISGFLARKNIMDYLKIGINSEGRGANFNLYSRDSWSQNTGISVGGVIKLGKSHLKLSPEYNSTKFEKDQKNRTLKTDLTIDKQETHNSLEKNYWVNLKTNIRSLEKTPETILNEAPKLAEIDPTLKTLITKKDYIKALKRIDSLILYRTSFTDLKKDVNKYKDYIRKEFIEYESNYSPLVDEYSLWWIDYNLSVGYNNFQFEDENINDSLLTTFTNDRSINRALIKGDINLNYTRNTANKVYYLQGGSAYTAGSFLNSNLITGTPEIATQSGNVFLIEDEEGQVLGSYDRITKPFQFMDLHLYGAMFFTKQKNFGFNLAFQHNFLIYRPKNTSYSNNFTLLGGPIFRTIKEGSTGATFGLDVGFENAAYKTNIQDDFTARIRIGIPFSIYSKEKK